MSARLHNMLPFRRLHLGLALLAAARGSNALSQTYCSSENTGSDFSVVTNIYQSNGACSTTCSGQYAFAIVQWQSCWCSNYIPSSQDDVSNCSQDCPGFPSGSCGNEDSGLFGYIQLSEPSGTAGGGGGAIASSSSSPSQQQTSTIIISSPSPSPTTQEQETSIPPRTSSTSPRPSTTSTSRPQTTPSATPVTSIMETTVSGEVITRTVTSTPTVVVGNASNDKVDISRSDGLSGGAVAGIVIGVVAGLAILAIAAFLLWRRKKNDGTDAAAGGASKKNMTRNVSVLSKAGLLSRGAQPPMGERDQDDAYTANGSNSVRHSMLFGPGAEGISPASPLGSSHGESSSSRRPSKPMVYDQRLNPSVLFSNSEANGSRISMQDTQDYSRPLGIANPDPRPSFESRKSNYRA